jgi:hypothetical protein
MIHDHEERSQAPQNIQLFPMHAPWLSIVCHRLLDISKKLHTLRHLAFDSFLALRFQARFNGKRED